MKRVIASAAVVVACTATGCSDSVNPGAAPTNTVATTASPGLSWTSAGDAEAAVCNRLSVFKTDQANAVGMSNLVLDVSIMYGDAASAHRLAPANATDDQLYSAARTLAGIVELTPNQLNSRAAAALSTLDQICPS